MSAELKNPQDYIMPPARGWGLYYDPLYGYIPIHPLIRRALDLPSMQRLRYIKQLSTVELVFAGASHSRFEHSVGVYWLATRLFDRLFDKRETYPRKERWPILGECHKLALQLAALFHDIGHGPGSHVFEIFCDRNPDFREFRHEKLTERLIREGMGNYRDIPEFLNRLYSRLRKQHRLYAEFVLPENVACIATGHPPPCDPSYLFLSQIISHVGCDVDRMDYLCRDSMHTGVDVGRVDIWELIHNFTLRPTVEGGETIWESCVEVDAAQALEALLTARDLAYRKIYYNKTHRAAQEMMTLGLWEAMTKYSKEQLALVSDTELLRLFEECGPFARDVATRIRFRRIYEPLPFEISLERDLDERARRQVARYALPKSRREYEKTLDFFKETSVKLGLPEDSMVIYDIQPTPLTRKEAFTVPYLWDDAGQKAISLMDVLPHLRLVHGETTFAGRKYDLHEQYIGYSYQIIIALPFEYLSHCIDQMEEELRVEVGTHSAEIAQIRKAAQKVYASKVELIIHSLIDWINLDDPGRKTLLIERFKQDMTTYLTNVYMDRKELI